MTESGETSSTRPISVAELLARNGNIGSPPVTGRRRRHRSSADADAVTVAELTGEIPIVRDQTPDPTGPAGLVQLAEPAPAQARPESARPDDRGGYRVARPSAPPQHAPSGVVAAEQMVPDFINEDDDDHTPTDHTPTDFEGALPGDLSAPVEEPTSAPSYLRSTAGPLFGGQTVADDLARRGAGADPAHAPLVAEREPALDGQQTHPPRTGMSKFLRGAWVVVQSILAVAFGAGLFIGFDELWKWKNIVALVLSVLVILGLVVGVRVVRKTEDIASTLIAVAVGALVTLGPLALLQSN